MAEEGEEGGNAYELKTSEGELLTKSKHFTGVGQALYPAKGESGGRDTYDGHYVNGHRTGPGTYVFAQNGDAYTGHYQDNQKDGFGKMTYSSKTGGDEEDEGAKKKKPRGGQYLGYYRKGLRGNPEIKKDVPGETNPAEGTFTYANGDVYVGQWKDGKKHGAGSYSYAKDGTKLVGEWEAGKILNGKWILPNGTYYIGAFRYNKPYGRGLWIFRDGNQLVGEFAQKEKAAGDEGGGEEEQEQKPDPEVWCAFKPEKSELLSGGSMPKPRN